MRQATRIALLLLILAVSLWPLVAQPREVYAIADPDSPPSIFGVWVFEDLLEDGDCGVFVDYYLDYAATPTETATEAYLVSFIDTDGTTQLGTTAPYAFDDKGYGRGAAWIYFTAAEVTALSIDAANELLYSVWLHGNPTVASGWAGDPPKTSSTIDEWYEPDEGDPAVLLRLLLLFSHGPDIASAWSEDILVTTAEGTRLSIVGEVYYTNVIPNLRTISPACFQSGEYPAIYEPIGYETAFGATIEDGTGTLTVSPQTLTEGTTTVTATGAGTFILELEDGTGGSVIAGTATLTDDPVTLVAGTNTITITVIGTLLVTVELQNTQAGIWGFTSGTAFDLTDVATAFGMSVMVFSGLTWLVITIIICAAVHKAGTGGTSTRGFVYSGGSSKGVLVAFDVCIIGGATLGMLPLVVAALMFISFGFLTGYVLFYRTANF